MSQQRSPSASRKLTAHDKSASFHGRIPTTESPRQMRRPKTQPDLLAGRREGSLSPNSPAPPRVPSKILVNVTVQRSLGAVQVMASTDWSVSRLIDAALQQYVREGRRPALPSAEPSSYGLHYSQFSLDSLKACKSLEPEQKLNGLGSRNFFLCPKKAEVLSSSGCKPTATSCSEEVKKGGSLEAGGGLPWLAFMDYLL